MLPYLFFFMVSLREAVGVMNGRAVLSMKNNAFEHSKLGINANENHKHASLIVAVSGALAESTQTSRDASGGTLLLVGCVLVCVAPVLLFVGAAAYPRDQKPRVVTRKAEEDVFHQIPTTILLPSSGQHTQTDDPINEIDIKVESPGLDTSHVTLESQRQNLQHKDSRSLDSNVQGATRSELSFHSSALQLCPGLVVRQPDGITLAMIGQIAPYQQSEVIEFKKFEGTNDTTVARAIISEGENGGGVILESGLRLPIVFVHTEHAVRAPDGSQPANRRVTVSRAMQQVGADDHPWLFSTIQADSSGEGVVMWQGAASKRVVLLAVRIDGDGRVANIVDANGRLLATTEVRDQDAGSRPMRSLHIASGIDATLIMTVLIATFKLQ